MDALQLQHRDVAKPPFRLLDLPPELRNNVYRHIIEKFERKSRQERRARHVRGAFAQIPKQLRSFLLSCKTIWGELLSLFFGSYTWTADLHFSDVESGVMRIVPQESWLLSGSTWRKPTSGTIRNVQFKIDHKHVTGWHAKMLRGFWFSINISLINSAPYLTFLVEKHIFGDDFMSAYEASSNMKEDLSMTAKKCLDKLKDAKRKSREGITGITIEEWQEIVAELKATYLGWFRREMEKPAYQYTVV